MTIRTCLLAVTAVASWSMTAVGNEINTLLEVDISDLSAVIISSKKGAMPTVDSSAQSAFKGVLLTGFFAEAKAYAEPASSSDLIASGTNRAYDNAESSSSGLDLNLFYKGIMQNHDFVTTSPAFTGRFTLDLTGRTFNPLGVGDVIERDAVGSEPIGQWVIINEAFDGAPSAKVASADAKAVPEPTTFALLLVGLAAIGVGRSRASAVA